MPIILIKTNKVDVISTYLYAMGDTLTFFQDVELFLRQFLILGFSLGRSRKGNERVAESRHLDLFPKFSNSKTLGSLNFRLRSVDIQ